MSWTIIWLLLDKEYYMNVVDKSLIKKKLWYVFIYTKCSGVHWYNMLVKTVGCEQDSICIITFKLI